MLKKGDTCYVRFKGGIEKVYYLNPAAYTKKWHWIKLKDGTITTVNRFVCMTGMKGKDNEI